MVCVFLTRHYPYSISQCCRVYDILSGKSEAEKILYRDPSPEYGYVVLPDMKWDLTTIASLYLVAIVLTKDIRSLRDLRKRHLGMLRRIRKEATRVVKEKWGLPDGSLRFYIHYQPSYCGYHSFLYSIVQTLRGRSRSFPCSYCSCQLCRHDGQYGRSSTSA